MSDQESTLKETTLAALRDTRAVYVGQISQFEAGTLRVIEKNRHGEEFDMSKIALATAKRRVAEFDKAIEEYQRLCGAEA